MSQEYNKELYIIFGNFQKAYDSVDRNSIDINVIPVPKKNSKFNWGQYKTYKNKNKSWEYNIKDGEIRTELGADPVGVLENSAHNRLCIIWGDL